MAGRAEIKCIGPSGALGDRKASVQRSINLYMRRVEGVGEEKQVYLQSAPGLTLLATMAGVIRGSYNAGGRWFVAAGAGLYEVSAAGAITSRGALAGFAGFVSMIHGRDQLVIVEGAQGHVFNLLTNSFAPLSDPDFRGSNWVDELDGYFIFAAPNSDQFYLSAIDDVRSVQREGSAVLELNQ